MAIGSHRAREQVQSVLNGRTAEELRARLAPKTEPKARRVPGGALTSDKAVRARWELVGGAPDPDVLDAWTAGHAESFGRNVENLIGSVKIPVGLAGPLRVNGFHAKGDYHVPLATTEAALVASYARGALLLTEAGGCSAAVLSEGVTRAPAFLFDCLADAAAFAAWLAASLPELKACAERTTRHGRLVDLRLAIEGCHVYAALDFRTGDASGQNMVTIATEAVLAHILAHAPVQPRRAFVEGNFSGDKKASAASFLLVRGRKVVAEALLPAALLRKRLHTDAAAMEEYWRVSAIGGVLSGTMGVQGHYANGLAALYLATGQDAACVAESAVGVTRFEQRANGALYASVTLPNLMVATVGGGTGLPSQQACLRMLGLAGAGHAAALAEVTAGLLLAGELSIIGALTAGDFTRAHRKLARGA